jgi:hypothetical protein
MSGRWCWCGVLHVVKKIAQQCHKQKSILVTTSKHAGRTTFTPITNLDPKAKTCFPFFV